MHELPHHYVAFATGGTAGDVDLQSPHLPALGSASPAEFGGPGDRWSPETLLVAALADCFVLTFRAVARASGLAWTSVRCEVIGTLDRVERATQFTAFTMRVELRVSEGTTEDLARRAVEKAERNCLITNSLKAPVRLAIGVTAGGRGDDLAESARAGASRST
jgi:organic hydroperoxide reductase OsmC/OhrA